MPLKKRNVLDLFVLPSCAGTHTHTHAYFCVNHLGALRPMQSGRACLPNDRWWVFSIAGLGAICHRLSRNKPSMEMNLFIHIKHPARAAAYTLNMHHSNNCCHHTRGLQDTDTHIHTQQQQCRLSCGDPDVMTAKCCKVLQKSPRTRDALLLWPLSLNLQFNIFHLYAFLVKIFQANVIFPMQLH